MNDHAAESDRYGFLSSDGYPEEGPNPLIKPPPSAENDCPCGRGPGHVRIKTAGCTPSAENDAPRVNGHAVERYALGWRCVNCDARLLTLMQFQGVECPTRPIPPAGGDGS